MTTKNHLKWLTRFIVGIWLVCLLAAVFFSGVLVALSLPPSNASLKIETIFDSLTAEMRFSYTNLRIEDNPFHFGRDDIAAHFHTDTKEICIKPETLDNYPEAIWHEIAHALNFSLNDSASDFEQKWGDIGEGYLTSYGSKTGSYDEERGRREDVADCVKYVYCEAYGYDSEFHFLPPKQLDDQNSPFFRKINLLLEHRFFNQETYDRALSHLLKKN